MITYGAAADRREVRLRAEIAEYIVTDSMEAQFEELLRKMQLATSALRAPRLPKSGHRQGAGVEALRTNNSFKPVGVAVRAFCPFLPNKIPKPALDHFHRRQSRVQWRVVSLLWGRELRVGPKSPLRPASVAMVIQRVSDP